MSRVSPKTRAAPAPVAQRETVLVMTIGTSPSVLTSTIWALAHHQRIVPHQIRVLTTRLGRDRLIEQVFSPTRAFGKKSAWDSLCQSLEADGFDLAGRLQFAPSPAYLRVYTATSPGERIASELDDITSQAENEQVADAMLETLRGVMNDDTHVIASIAGGRKTVSALFYACVSLIGRGGDRIIHVVVNEPFDRPDLQPPFFFPSQESGRLESRDGRAVRARDAQLSVIEVPFVPLANLFPKELGRTPGRFSALVAEYREVGRRQSLADLRLTVHLSRREIDVDDMPVELGPREHLLAILLGEHGRAGNPPFATVQDLADAAEEKCKQLYAERSQDDWSDWRHKLGSSAGVRRSLTVDDIRRSLSSLGRKLRNAGPPAAKLVAALPQRGRFALALGRNQVRLVK